MLKIKNLEKAGLAFETAIVIVRNISISSDKNMIITIGYYNDNNINGAVYTEKLKTNYKNGDVFIEAKEHLRTLDEFKDAVDA